MKNTLDGGEAILEACRKLGVDYILSSPGTEWAPVWEAMAKQIPIADLGSSVTAPMYIARFARLQLYLGHVDAAATAIAAAEQVRAKAGVIADQEIHVSVIRAEVDAAQGKRAAALSRLHRAKADADQRGLVTWSKDAERALARIGS